MCTYYNMQTLLQYRPMYVNSSLKLTVLVYIFSSYHQ